MSYGRIANKQTSPSWFPIIIAATTATVIADNDNQPPPKAPKRQEPKHYPIILGIGAAAAIIILSEVPIPDNDDDPRPPKSPAAAARVIPFPAPVSVISFADVRKRFAEELKDPETRRLLMASTHAEVGGQGSKTEQAYMESVINRAAAEGRSLSAVLRDPKYYPATTKAKLGLSVNKAEQARMGPLIDAVLGGSNISNLATGNESGPVHSGGAEVTFNPGTGERFVAEKWTTKWREHQLRGEQPAVLRFKLVDGKSRSHVDGLAPEFAKRLGDLFKAMPAKVQQRTKILSGYRSIENQRRLFEAAIVKYGSEANARHWVAPPGQSMHNRGLAVDLQYANQQAREWVQSNAGKYRLVFPMPWEPWHIEPNDVRNRKREASAIGSTALVANVLALKRFTVRQGRRYHATVTLRGYEQWATNEMIADRLRRMGFTEIEVKGSGANRESQARWPRSDTTSPIDEHLTNVYELPAPL